MNNLFRLENEEFRKYKMYILNIGNEESVNYGGAD